MDGNGIVQPEVVPSRRLHLRRAGLPHVTMAVPVKEGTQNAGFFEVDVVHHLFLFRKVTQSYAIKAQVDQYEALFRLLDSPCLFTHAVNNQQVA